MDVYGHVNNARFLTLYEEARVAFMFVGGRERGLTSFEEGIVIARHEVDYLRPVDYADPVRTPGVLNPDVTQATIDVFKRLRSEFGLNDVGIVLQSYLRRTMDDARELLKIPARIRLCKGAYDEPASVAYPDKKDVDDNYVRVMQLLLASGTYHGIATHDPKMIEATIEFAQREGIGKDAFEFQMLYGIRRDLQEQLARDGYGMRVYVPYGKHWYPYFMRRLAERPANIWFVLKNLFR